MQKMPSVKRLFAYFVFGAGLAVCALAAYTWLQQPEHPSSGRPSSGRVAERQQPARRPPATPQRATPQQKGGWTVGELRAGGLRIRPSGRADASAVLAPEPFFRPAVKRAYAIARQIPATLNELYCWCGCENRGRHRSNLACFEDRMAVNCAVCRGTAEIAYRMGARQGVTDPAKIQAAVDKEWGPERAVREQQRREG